MVASPRWIVASLLVFVCAGIVESPVMAQGKAKIRYALGDVISIDELPLLIAAERAKARGVEVEITAFKSEEVATQAVINGQADIGQGTPYAAVQKATVPLRFFYQLSTLQFFPVVAKDSYKSWKDLDGQEGSRLPHRVQRNTSRKPGMLGTRGSRGIRGSRTSGARFCGAGRSRGPSS
jgi:NitT/TauT family transport system substrate-binding protein